MEAGRIVRSVAGHDKDRFYLVVRAEGDRVYIADGRLRKLAAPKAKNPLHLRPTGTLIEPETATTDKRLRELLKPWNDGLRAAPAHTEGGK